jgi:hypothetical protein
MSKDTNTRNPIIDNSADIVETRHCSPLLPLSSSLALSLSCIALLAADAGE